MSSAQSTVNTALGTVEVPERDSSERYIIQRSEGSDLVPPYQRRPFYLETATHMCESDGDFDTNFQNFQEARRQRQETVPETKEEMIHLVAEQICNAFHEPTSEAKRRAIINARKFIGLTDPSVMVSSPFEPVEGAPTYGKFCAHGYVCRETGFYDSHGVFQALDDTGRTSAEAAEAAEEAQRPTIKSQSR